MDLEIRAIQNQDFPGTLSLVKRVFDRFEAPDYTSDGIAEFYKYIQVDAMISRISENHFCLLAIHKSEIIGVIEIRDFQHISLLFVDSNYHRLGIGRKLWAEGFKKCIESKGKILKFTVNSSPFAVPVYEKLGFSKSSNEQIVNGIRFFPMSFANLC